MASAVVVNVVRQVVHLRKHRLPLQRGGDPPARRRCSGVAHLREHRLPSQAFEQPLRATLCRVIPRHDYIRDVLQRQSALQSAEPWVDTREVVEKLTGPRRTYAIKDISHLDRAMHFFGDPVAFDREAWLRDGR